jgi:hypothetical protein
LIAVVAARRPGVLSYDAGRLIHDLVDACAPYRRRPDFQPATPSPPTAVVAADEDRLALPRALSLRRRGEGGS